MTSKRKSPLVVSISQDAGITIVLFLMLTVTLLTLAGFVIEIVTAETTKQECMVIAEQIVTTSLRKLSKIRTPTSNPEQVLSAVLADARAMAASSHTLGKLEGGGGYGNILLSTEQALNDAPVAGVLTPGTWYDEDHDCGSNHAPCFEEYTGTEDFNALNAFKVMIQTPTSLQRVFSKIFGGAPMKVSAETIGVVVPRRFVILADMSPSITEENYLMMNPEPVKVNGGDMADSPLSNYIYNQETPAPNTQRVRGISARFAFQSFYPSSEPPHENFMLQDCMENLPWDPSETYPNGVPIDFYDDYSYLSDKFAYCALESNYLLPPEVPALWDTTELANKKHYKEDYYGQIDFQGPDSDYPTGMTNRIFYYDQRSALDLKNIEPLFSVLRAINASVSTFNESKLPTDGVGLIAFDENIPANDTSSVRMFPLSNDVSAILTATNPDIADPVGDQGSWLNKFLWPRPSWTDIYPAMERAYAWISAADALTPGPTKNVVLLFTDGMFNCQNTGAIRECDEFSPYYNWNAYENVQRHLVPLYLQKEIELDVFLLGDRSMPNYVRWQDPENPGHCVDPIRGRQLGYVMTRGSTPVLLPIGSGIEQIVWGNGRWGRPNQLLWDLASATGGMFFPIMPPQDPDMILVGNCTHNYIPRDPIGEWGYVGANPVPQQYFVDPASRSKEEQMRDYMSTIMGEIPVRLVVEYPH